MFYLRRLSPNRLPDIMDNVYRYFADRADHRRPPSKWEPLCRLVSSPLKKTHPSHSPTPCPTQGCVLTRLMGAVALVETPGRERARDTLPCKD